MRLDGECYRLGDSHLPIGLYPDVATRCAAALGSRSPRLTAALGTAAWVWGVGTSPPLRAEFLVALDARWRPPAGSGIRIIESVIHADDVVRLGRASVTTRLRTVIDLARFRRDFSEGDADVIRRLAHAGGFGLAETLDAMNRTRNLAGKRRASERLRTAFSPS